MEELEQVAINAHFLVERMTERIEIIADLNAAVMDYQTNGGFTHAEVPTI